ncbi:SIS domain-containing protein [Cytobacillus praedii]|uniref:Fructosamine deglycase n=1 Tax=Cytobacillus praedii TaxID=1742358 RepID=A0A4R1AVN5_9BACI|nr:SIS domain-containing protein [Cytobacillus praedii]TCJ02487.1 SIS domain-containing protein [Cytobacillus praedii]
MLKFNEAKQIESVNGALQLRSEVEKIVDQIYSEGFDNIFYLGIGGTYASSMQAVTYIAGKSALPAYVENAAEYLTTGNRKLTKQSVVVISSVTGSTEEMVRAVSQVKEVGARIVGFIDVKEAPLAQSVDYLISYPANEQIKFFMVADRLMFNAGDFPEYEQFYKELDEHLATALVNVEKAADSFGEQFALAHNDDSMHYFVGAGNHWGAVYSYAMCYWEEQHWLRSKSIHSSEFLHGTLEVIDRDTAITVFVGEDEQRPLSERVANFLPRICSRYTIIDTKDYELEGISPQFRGRISHLVLRAITQRIDAHIEKINCHPMEIRRYYRQLDY